MPEAPLCGVMHGDYSAACPVDLEGCRLPEGHHGPHEFCAPDGRVWQWETDFECACEHCRLCEGDYCTIYWEKRHA